MASAGQRKLKHYLKEHGIIAETNAHYSTQSNGIAERKNRALIEMVNPIFITSDLPTYYWREALLMVN